MLGQWSANSSGPSWLSSEIGEVSACLGSCASRTGAAAFLALALPLLGSTTAVASDLHEDFSAAGSNCSAQWFAGCVDGWLGTGAQDSVARTHLENSPSTEGVLVKGGSTQAPNGIVQNYTLPTSFTAQHQLVVQSIGQTGEVRVQVVYRDAQGQAISTSFGSWTAFPDMKMTFVHRDFIPDGSVSMDVELVVVGSEARIFIQDWLWKGDGAVSGSTRPTEEECQEAADEQAAEDEAACDLPGGTWFGGGCNGFPHPTEDVCVTICGGQCTDLPSQGVAEVLGFD